jgi:hypothetical protein
MVRRADRKEKMIELLLVLGLSCPTPKIINTSGYAWNDFDQQTLNRAKKRCGQLYPKSPCVKKFFKTEEITYQVICGAK